MIDFRIGGDQVQPVWMVITSPRYTSKEMRQAGSCAGQGKRNVRGMQMNKYRLICWMLDHGCETDEIAREVGMHERSKVTWLHRYGKAQGWPTTWD